MNMPSEREFEFPLTITEWKAAQRVGDGLTRLLVLASSERASNTQTRTWITVASDKQIKDQWERLPSPDSPLYGVPFAVKDNIDAETFYTTAGCPAFAKSPATQDASVVARLKAAGAVLIGKTNLDQFATGLVGTRSPYGAVPNTFDETRVSGGSSSGSAASVARGSVPFSLGTDTAGSGRVPAGLNNIYGLKPTRGAISTHGVVPACRSLDCVSIFALTADDAETVLSVAEGFDLRDAYSRSRPEDAWSASPAGTFGARHLPPNPRIAICKDPDWSGQSDNEAAYTAALRRCSELGWELVPVDFRSLFKLARLLYDGPWVAERFAAIKEFIMSHADEMDPTVWSIVSGATCFSATDAFEAEYQRKDLTREIDGALRNLDCVLVPTTPAFPTLEEVARDPIGENSKMGTYTNFVNFLDWSALAIPAGFRGDGLPFGITLMSNMWQDHHLL